MHCLSKSLLLLPLLFAACSGDQLASDSEAVALSVAQVATTPQMIRSSTAVTSGDIGVFLSGAGYTPLSNVKYSYGTPWTTATPIYLLEANANICAYSPYSASMTNASAVTLTSQLYSASADLCYAANTTKTKASPAINFTMNRAYSRITFNITHEETYTGACVVSNISVANAGVCTGGTLDVTTGTLTGTTAGTVSITPSTAITVAANGTGSVQLLMVPVTTAMTGDVTVSFTVDGVVRSATISASSLSTLTAGTNYTINASMGKTGITTALANISGTGTMVMTVGPANCYMLNPGASITIPVNIKGNGEPTSAALGSLTPTHTAASVGIVWQTTTGLITCTDFNSTSQTVKVNAPVSGTSGNAVVAAYAADGTTILWSWHIWVTNYNPGNVIGNTYSYVPTAGVTNVFMDRNLGALTTTYIKDANILYFQWGRKDPFPAADVEKAGATTAVDVTITTTQSMLFSSQNPFKFISSTNSPYDWCSTQGDYYWMGTGGTLTTPGIKTIYDPCPSGWRVPAWCNGLSPWNGLSTTGATWGSGYTWPIIDFWPAAGYHYYNSNLFRTIEGPGYYWSASPYNSDGYCLGFSSGTVLPANGRYRAHGFSVRCVLEW